MTFEEIVEKFMDVLFSAVGDTFTFHSNYTPNVDIPSITVKVLPNGIEPLSITMTEFSYNVILTIRQNEQDSQSANFTQANTAFQQIFRAFKDGITLSDSIEAVCNNFDMSYTGENYNVPQITFDFDYIDISRKVGNTVIENMNLELKG